MVLSYNFFAVLIFVLGVFLIIFGLGYSINLLEITNGGLGGLKFILTGIAVGFVGFVGLLLKFGPNGWGNPKEL